MKEFYINTEDLYKYVEEIQCGDKIFLSGTVFTARDAAHKKIFEILDNNSTLPFELNESVVYYAGPTPTPQNLAIGSCGPTTASRMDTYSPRLFDLGVRCVIGKGERNQEVINSIIKNKCLYLCAIGGAGALACSCITSCKIIAFDELGCESIKELEFDNFPLICGIDSFGGNLFKK